MIKTTKEKLVVLLTIILSALLVSSAQADATIIIDTSFPDFGYIHTTIDVEKCDIHYYMTNAPTASTLISGKPPFDVSFDRFDPTQPMTITCVGIPGYRIEASGLELITNCQNGSNQNCFRGTCNYIKEIPNSFSQSEPILENKPLPEDDLGSYYFQDNEKVYAWYHSWAICVAYMGEDYCKNNPTKYKLN